MSYFSVKLVNTKTLLRLKERTHALRIAQDAVVGKQTLASPFRKKSEEFYLCESMISSVDPDESPDNEDLDQVRCQQLDFWIVRLNLFDQVQYVPITTDPIMDSSSLLLLHYIGNWDASLNLFPELGGTGDGGSVARGDVWDISVGGILGGVEVNAGAQIWARVNEPGQVLANWRIFY